MPSRRDSFHMKSFIISSAAKPELPYTFFVPYIQQTFNHVQFIKVQDFFLPIFQVRFFCPPWHGGNFNLAHAIRHFIIWNPAHLYYHRFYSKEPGNKRLHKILRQGFFLLGTSTPYKWEQYPSQQRSWAKTLALVFMINFWGFQGCFSAGER